MRRAAGSPHRPVDSTAHVQHSGGPNACSSRAPLPNTVPYYISSGYPFNRSCPTPLLPRGGSLEAAPGSADAHAPAAALAGLSEVDSWR